MLWTATRDILAPASIRPWNTSLIFLDYGITSLSAMSWIHIILFCVWIMIIDHEKLPALQLPWSICSRLGILKPSNSHSTFFYLSKI
jgi:hypothetical protein